MPRHSLVRYPSLTARLSNVLNAVSECPGRIARKSEGVNRQACGLASWLMVPISCRIGFIKDSSESCTTFNLPMSSVKFLGLFVTLCLHGQPTFGNPKNWIDTVQITLK
jgi:hypothetical protein